MFVYAVLVVFARNDDDDASIISTQCPEVLKSWNKSWSTSETKYAFMTNLYRWGNLRIICCVQFTEEVKNLATVKCLVSIAAKI